MQGIFEKRSYLCMLFEHWFQLSNIRALWITFTCIIRRKKRHCRWWFWSGRGFRWFRRRKRWKGIIRWWLYWNFSIVLLDYSKIHTNIHLNARIRVHKSKSWTMKLNSFWYAGQKRRHIYHTYLHLYLGEKKSSRELVLTWTAHDV